MTPPSTERGTTACTFADLASTYRFFGLTGAVALTVLGLNLMRQYLFWAAAPDSITRMLNTPDLFWGAGSFFGIPLGLLFGRGKAAFWIRATLIFCAALNLGVLFIDAKSFPAALVGWTNQATLVALCIAVPSLLAGWAKDQIAVATTLVILASYQLVSEFLSEILPLFDREIGILFVGIAGATAMLAAALLIFPIREQGFETIPSPHRRPLTPKRRSTLRIALMTSLPWISALGIGALSVLAPTNPSSSEWVRPVLLTLLAAGPIGMGLTTHWFYRIHGEVVSMMPSTKILTSKAAIWIYVLVPFSVPLLLLNLGDALRDLPSRSTPPSRGAAIWFTVWAIFFPPVAMGIVQCRLNRECRWSSRTP